MAKDNREKANEFVEKGKEEFKNGNFKKAKKYFTRAVKEDSFNNSSNYYLGKISRLEGDFEKARKHLEKIMEAQNTSLLTETAIELSLVYSKIDKDMAINYLELFLQDNSNRLKPFDKQSIKYTIGKNLVDKQEERAKPMLEEVIEFSNNRKDEYEQLLNSRARNDLAKAYLLDWEDDKAIQLCEETLGLLKAEHAEKSKDISEQQNERDVYLIGTVRKLILLYKRNNNIEKLNQLLEEYSEIPELQSEFERLKINVGGKQSTIQTLKDMYFSDVDGERFGKMLEGIILPVGHNETAREGNKIKAPAKGSHSYSEELLSINRLEKFNEYKPSGISVGDNNFEGYCMLEYEDLGIIILEKFLEKHKSKNSQEDSFVESYGSATYILPLDIEIDVTANTKTQIKVLKESEQYKIAILSHTKTYYERLDDLISLVKEKRY